MTELNNQSTEQLALTAKAKAARRQSQIFLLGVVALLIGVAFFTWHGTWYGRPLSDKEIQEYLSDPNKPNHVQHALTVLEKRIREDDPTAKQWYPKIIAQADSPQPEIRLWAAWVMGQDNKSDEFHQTLLRLLKDSYVQVRRNAAVQLVRFNDPSGRREIVSMLRPVVIQAPVAGVISTALRNGDSVGIGVLLVSVKEDNDKVAEIRSSVKGDVRSLQREGSRVALGDEIMSIGPDQEAMVNALTALALIGDGEDAPEIDHFIATEPNLSKSIKETAARTADALRNRQPKPIAN